MSKITTLELTHFKAFKESVTFSLGGKNFLLFGENGAGKTSVFEALKFAFFHEKIEAKKIPASTQPEDAIEKKKELYDSYKNANTKTPFSIQINGISYDAIVRNDYRVFLINYDDFTLPNDSIVLEDVLANVYFDYNDQTPSSLMQLIGKELETAVNDGLKNHFSESIQVKFDKGDKYRCILSDLGGKLEYGTNLSHYFNEGKIHLILLIIYINIFLLLVDRRQTNILVLDDFITSLDAANRVFVLKYIFEEIQKQESLQTLIFTHNVSFYNLAKHYINKYLPTAESGNWGAYNLYCLGNEHKIYPQNDDSVEEIEKDLREGNYTIDKLGNRVRQQFEIQVHEIAKIIISGGLEESKNILSRLEEGKPLYFYNSNDVYDLIKTIETIVQNSAYRETVIAQHIQSAINNYMNDSELESLRKILKQMTLFQKVSLHPTSHGTLGLVPASQKELKESIQLIKKIQESIKSIPGKNVINM